jgi:hypothetical protein
MSIMLLTSYTHDHRKRRITSIGTMSRGEIGNDSKYSNSSIHLKCHSNTPQYSSHIATLAKLRHSELFFIEIGFHVSEY